MAKRNLKSLEAMMKKQVLHYTESHNGGLKLQRKNLKLMHEGGNDFFPWSTNRKKAHMAGA